MCDAFETSIPRLFVLVTLKPLIVTQFLARIVKALSCPVTVTVAPGAVVNTIGALDVPELPMVTSSEYVPAATCTVWPAPTTCAAAPIVQNGRSIVPELLFEQEGFERST